MTSGVYLLCGHVTAFATRVTLGCSVIINTSPTFFDTICVARMELIGVHCTRNNSYDVIGVYGRIRNSFWWQNPEVQLP
jgi:hypothetical protein